MGVAGQDLDGNYYRLRSGFFDVAGPAAFVTLDTEVEPTTTEYITADVPTGEYSLQLQPGWWVEQWGSVLRPVVSRRRDSALGEPDGRDGE